MEKGELKRLGEDTASDPESPPDKKPREAKGAKADKDSKTEPKKGGKADSPADKDPAKDKRK